MSLIVHRRCPTGKVPHPTQESAQWHIDDLIRQKKAPPKSRRRLNVYMCRHCGSYHVGHRRHAA